MKWTLCFLLLFGPLSAFSFPHPFKDPIDFTIGPLVSSVKRERGGGSTQKGVMWGLHAQLEHLSPGSFYWAVEGSLSQGALHGKTSTNLPLKSTLREAEMEGRLGLTLHHHFFCRPWTLIPFVGYSSLRSSNSFRSPSPIFVTFNDTVDYVISGFLLKTRLNSCLEGEILFKAKWMFEGTSHTRDDPSSPNASLIMENKWSYDIELPLIYTPCCRNWDIRLTPYYHYRHYGARENFPFNFIETTFYFWGTRLEASATF